MFKHLKLAQQLGLGFAVVLLLLVAVSVASYWSISSASSSLLAYEASVTDADSAWEQQADVFAIQNHALNNLVSNDPKALEHALQVVKELEGDIDARIAAADSPASRETLNEMKQDIEQFSQLFTVIGAQWDERNAILKPMISEGAQMIALMDEVIADFTRDRNVKLLSLAAKAQKELIFARLYVVKYLEDNSEKQFKIGADAMSDAQLGSSIGRIEEGVKDPEIQDDLRQFEALRNSYVAGLNRLHEVLTTRNQMIDQAINELAPELTHDFELLKERAQANKVSIGHDAEAVGHFSKLLIAIISAVAILLGAAIAYLLPRAIRKPIGGEPRDIEAVAQTVAAGDLTIEFANTGKETGIYAAMRGMTAQLAQIVGDVSDSASTVSAASSQIAAGSQELSQRTEEQASSLEETAASIEEMTSTVKQNADNAQEASQLAEGARDNAVKGGEVVKRAQSAMDEISAASNQIKEIIEVIEGISFQTNLLSLNASVEAARAGEQGRGFAVVAAEVGKLASKSSDAAKDIKGLINSTVAKVESGATLVAQSGSALDEIIQSVNRVTDIVAEIAAASQEQAAGISQVNKAVTQMDEVTQHNSSLVEETAAAAEALSEQAEHLKQLIGFFKTTAAANGAVKAAVNEVPKRAEAPKRAESSKPVLKKSVAKATAKASALNEDEWTDF